MVVGSWLCRRHTVALSLGLRWLAMVKIQAVGFWLALAMVVLDPSALVYTVADHRLDMVAGLVAVVGLAMVAVPLVLLVGLVGDCLQRVHHLALAPD